MASENSYLGTLDGHNRRFQPRRWRPHLQPRTLLRRGGRARTEGAPHPGCRLRVPVALEVPQNRFQHLLRARASTAAASASAASSAAVVAAAGGGENAASAAAGAAAAATAGDTLRRAPPPLPARGGCSCSRGRRARKPAGARATRAIRRDVDSLAGRCAPSSEGNRSPRRDRSGGGDARGGGDSVRRSALIAPRGCAPLRPARRRAAAARKAASSVCSRLRPPPPARALDPQQRRRRVVGGLLVLTHTCSPSTMTGGRCGRADCGRERGLADC